MSPLRGSEAALILRPRFNNRHSPAAQRRNLDSPARECRESVRKKPESASADGTRFLPAGARFRSGVVLRVEHHGAVQALAIALGAEVLLIAQCKVQDAALA